MITNPYAPGVEGKRFRIIYEATGDGLAKVADQTKLRWSDKDKLWLELPYVWVTVICPPTPPKTISRSDMEALVMAGACPASVLEYDPQPKDKP